MPRLGQRHTCSSSLLLGIRRLATTGSFTVRFVAGHWPRTTFSRTLHTLVGSTDVILAYATRSALFMFFFVLLHVFSSLRTSRSLGCLSFAYLCILPLVHDWYTILLSRAIMSYSAHLRTLEYGK